jgi:ATP-dependent DNA helicase HFM1/MER3
MANDTSLIFQHCIRIIKSIIEACIVKKDAFSLKSALDLGKSLAAKTWENSPLLLKQIDGIGVSFARMLSNAGINTFKKIKETDARTIEFALNRNPPFGNKVLDAVAKFPELSMNISQVKDLINPSEVELYIQLSLRNREKVKLYGKSGSFTASLLVYTNDYQFIHYQKFFFSKLIHGENVRIMTRITDPKQTIHCALISDDFAGLDISEEVLPDIKARPKKKVNQFDEDDLDFDSDWIQSCDQAIDHFKRANSSSPGDSFSEDGNEYHLIKRYIAFCFR